MTKKETMGNIGERIVAKLFNGAALSEDKYDSTADIYLPDGSNIEVKTQYPFKNDVTVKADQLPKCIKADRLIFVVFNHTSVVRVLDVPQSVRADFKIFNTRDGRCMAKWNMDDLTEITRIEDPELAEKLQSLSSSKQLKKQMCVNNDRKY